VFESKQASRQAGKQASRQAEVRTNNLEPFLVAVTCKDEVGNTYVEGAEWVIARCVICRCKQGLLECIAYDYDKSQLMVSCLQPDCNVWQYIDPSSLSPCLEGNLSTR